MTKEELLTALADLAGRLTGVLSAGRVEGEDAMGIEMEDGTEYFLTITEA